MLKFAIVDDSRDVQVSMSRLLGSIDGLELVGCAEDMPSAARLIDAQRPDVVVLDIDLRGGDRGLDVLHHVKRMHPQAKVVMLSNFTWQGMRDAFLGAGASAYFDKAMQCRELRDWMSEAASADGRH